jgi:uncharacterized RDD family membrane protein YckC
LPSLFAAYFAIGVGVELEKLPPEVLTWTREPVKSTVLAVALMFVLYSLWEPLFLANTGTTPGKWIMGIRIRTAVGNKLGYLTALSRMIRVWIVGMGLGLPIVSLITLLISRAKLNSDGQTGWDERLNLRVMHRKRNVFIWIAMLT